MFYHQDPNPYLVASTLTFLVPLHAAAQLELWQTQLVLSALLVASTSYHATKNGLLYYADQAAVTALVWRSVVDGLNGGPLCTGIAIGVNAACVYLYYYGRIRQTLIWSPQFVTATASHAGMHLLVAGGYTLLLTLYP
jgi:hypothetical protein